MEKPGSSGSLLDGNQHEAVAGKAVGGVFACCTAPDFYFNDHLRKIAGMVCIQLWEKVSDASQHVVMAFAKVARQIGAEGGGFAVNDGDGGRDSQCGLRHEALLAET